MVEVTAVFIHPKWSVGHYQAELQDRLLPGPREMSAWLMGGRGEGEGKILLFVALVITSQFGCLALWHHLSSSYPFPPLSAWCSLNHGPLLHGQGQGGQQGNLKEE